MSVCPYCGNEVEEYDCICGKCGNALEQTGFSSAAHNSDSSYNNNTYGSSNSGYSSNTYGNGNSGYGTNSYGNENSSYNNNGYGYQSNSNDSYNNPGGSYKYPPYNGANGSSYPPYNNTGYNNNTTGKMKKQGNGLIIGIVAAIVLAIIVAVAVPIIKNAMTKEYKQITQEAVMALIENDYLAFSEICAYDFNRMLQDFSGVTTEQASTLLEVQNEKAKQELRNQYGDNYKITTKIKSVSTLTGSKKKKAISDTKSDFETQINMLGMDVNVDNYFDEDSIGTVKRIKVKVQISGSAGSESQELWVDLAKVKGESGWKVLEIYMVTRK